jgi:hypothetical protein
MINTNVFTLAFYTKHAPKTKYLSRQFWKKDVDQVLSSSLVKNRKLLRTSLFKFSSMSWNSGALFRPHFWASSHRSHSSFERNVCTCLTNATENDGNSAYHLTYLFWIFTTAIVEKTEIKGKPSPLFCNKWMKFDKNSIQTGVYYITGCTQEINKWPNNEGCLWNQIHSATFSVLLEDES